MLFRAFILISFLFINTVVFGQSVHGNQQPDSIYVTSYRHLLNISTGLQTSNVEFIVAYPKNNLRFELSPRETLQQFLFLQYKWVNFRYSFTPSYLNPDRSPITGSNKRSSLDLFMAVGDIDISLSHQNAEGYYIKNTSDLLPTWKKGDPYLQLRTLKTTINSVEFAYNTNKKFSDVGMISGKSKQLKNATSFLPALSIAHIHFNDPTILPSPGSHTDDYNVDINLKLPVGASIVWAKDWSLAGAIGPIVGVNFFRTDSYNASLARISNKETRISTGYSLQGGLSFTKEKWYAGLNSYLHQYGSGNSESRTKRLFYGVELYIGKRFNAPVLLKKLL